MYNITHEGFMFAWRSMCITGRHLNVRSFHFLFGTVYGTPPLRVVLCVSLVVSKKYFTGIALVVVTYLRYSSRSSNLSQSLF